ncbi:LytR/AlgR family response regulator transcription factor [Roseivirga echinicomitans]
MKLVIIEDEALSAKRLAKMVLEIIPNAQLLASLASVSKSLVWLKENPKPDLIFLDIQLNDGNAFDILKEIKDYPRIIFTTAYEQYALDAFKHNSVDYLLKPIDYEELKKTFGKLEKIKQSEETAYKEKIDHLKTQFPVGFRERFLVKIGPQFKSIPTSAIKYFFYSDGLTYLQTEESALPIDYTLDQLKEELDPKLFFRINRQFILRISSIKEIHSYFNSRLLLTLSPAFKEEVIVSRERVLNFKIWAGM